MIKGSYFKLNKIQKKYKNINLIGKSTFKRI